MHFALSVSKFPECQSTLVSETLTRTVAENTVLSLGVQDDQERRVAKRLRTRAVERLWNLTEELNVLYRDNWTALADREMMRYFCIQTGYEVIV